MTEERDLLSSGQIFEIVIIQVAIEESTKVAYIRFRDSYLDFCSTTR
jgi:hypothetical protein